MRPKVKMEDLLGVLASLLKTYGEFVRKVGEIESEIGTSLEEMMKKMGEPEEFTEKLISEAPPDVVASFLKVIVGLSRFRGRDVFRLPPEEKVREGKRLESIAKELEKLYAKLKQR